MYAAGGWVQAAPQYGQPAPQYGWSQPAQVPVYGDVYGQAAVQPQVYAQQQYGFAQPQSAYQWPQPQMQQVQQVQQVPQTPMPMQQVDPVDIFMQELGIQDDEVVHFGWIADYGLQDDALPPGWTCHTDASSGRVFYADEATGESSWESPVADALRTTIQIGRMYLYSPTDTLIEEQMQLLYERHKQELDAWHGPMADDEGRHYYINSSTGVSSRQDPRTNTQFFWELEKTVLETLQETLVAPEQDGLPSFGLTEEELYSRLQTPDIFVLPEVPELDSPLGGSHGDTLLPKTPGKRASVLQLEMARERTEQAGRVHKEDLKNAYQAMLKQLNGIDFAVKDSEEAQRLIMTRKLRERRERKRRKEQEEHERRYGEEWRRSLEAMEAAKREEEARKKAEADVEEARKAEAFRQQREEEKRLAEERRREEEERKAAEEERQKVLAEKAAKLAAEAAEKAAEEEARRKVEEARKAREDLIGRLRDAVHSRNTEQLRTAMAEAEAAGLHNELEPLRQALQMELAARRAAAVKARKAAEKLAADFKSAKEAQDCGGATLAAQWRAAVKEVAKPFDEEQFVMEGTVPQTAQAGE